MDYRSAASDGYEAQMRGDFKAAQKGYQDALDTLLLGKARLTPDELDKDVRSIAFNLAQVLNRLGRYADALDRAEIGLRRNATPYGKAIGLAAKGEALYGLGRAAEGSKAFEEALYSHKIVGRLNSAESMIRIGGAELVQRASEWIDFVATHCDALLDEGQRREIVSLRKQIAAKRGAGR